MTKQTCVVIDILAKHLTLFFTNIGEAADSFIGTLTKQQALSMAVESIH